MLPYYSSHKTGCQFVSLALVALVIVVSVVAIALAVNWRQGRLNPPTKVELQLRDTNPEQYYENKTANFWQINLVIMGAVCLSTFVVLMAAIVYLYSNRSGFEHTHHLGYEKKKRWQ